MRSLISLFILLLLCITPAGAKDKFLAPVGTSTKAVTSADNVESFANSSGAVAVGNAVYLVSAGTVAKASATTLVQPSIGLVLELVDATHCLVLTRGVFTGYTTGMTAGTHYYLAESSGALQTTPVLTSGKLAQQIGYAVSSTDLMVEPQNMSLQGTSAGQLVTLDYQGYLPALDGRNLSNLPGGSQFSVHQVSHGLAATNAIRWDGSAWVKAKADSDAHADVDGFVVSSSGADDFVYATPWQFLDIFSGLTPGTTYFLSGATAGAYSSTDVNTAGYVSKPVLRAVTSSKALFLGMRGVTLGTLPSTTTVTSTPYSALSTDGIVLVAPSPAVDFVVNLPAGSSHLTKQITIKDKAGSAATHWITINANGVETIDGSSSIILNVNYGSVSLAFAGTEWSIF